MNVLGRLHKATADDPNEPPWIGLARSYIGEREVKGMAHNPVVVGFWKLAKLGGIKNDEVPWCAGFVGAMLEASGIRSARSDSSRAYLKWGERMDVPEYGCVVVFNRPGGGHVGFCVGIDDLGRLLILGGNQGDAVSILPFWPDRVAGFRRVPWNGAIPMLPSMPDNRPASENEA
jgi:uncharacterized protein (TIGR02594 family)